MATSRQSGFLDLLRSAIPWATATAVGAALASHALAQNLVAIENDEVTNVVARDPGGYWTPSELMGAQALALPIPSLSMEALRAQADSQGEPAPGVQVAIDGELPSEAAKVAPDLEDRLFPETPVRMESTSIGMVQQLGGAVQPFDVGTAGAYFSSSRLVPTDARLTAPYSLVVKLFFEKPGEGSFICSGAVLKPRLILTAGHCVHRGSGGADGFYSKFLVVPAYDNGQAPFQAWNWTWVITTNSWSTSNGNVPNQADFAIIEVEDRKFGSQVKKIGEVNGFFGYRTNALLPNHTKKLGYPANHDSGQIMHQVDSQHFENGGQSTVLYGSDMRGGSSGGPWVENFGVQAVGQTGGSQPLPNRIVGVTSYGYTATGPRVQGSSILNQEFLDILNAACSHKAGNC